MSARREPLSQNALASKLFESLRSALDLLQDTAHSQRPPLLNAEEPTTLLRHCLALCERGKYYSPEPMRTLHHFACTGGTLISKCIAAMPNVQLLSEVDPLSPRELPLAAPSFSPTDMITLLRQSSRGTRDELLVELFQSEMRVVYRDASQHGLRLVVRDHAHSHFCRGTAVPARPNLRALIPAEMRVLSAVTVRHPLDSYASLMQNGWIQFEPATFDTYCHRYLLFLDSYADVPVVRYEDFVTAPTLELKKLCTMLELQFQADFASLCPIFRISGDSGRTGNTIEARLRRPAAAQLASEARESVHYKALLRRLDYDSSDCAALT